MWRQNRLESSPNEPYQMKTMSEDEKNKEDDDDKATFCLTCNSLINIHKTIMYKESNNMDEHSFWEKIYYKLKCW